MHHANVVGVDGSESAVTAVRWAANDAALHRAPLRLLSVGPEALPDAARAADEVNRQRWLDSATRLATEVAPEVQVRSELRRGDPRSVLVEESEQARRVIVGIRGLAERTGLPVGSIADAVAMHAACPVAVVRGRVPEAAARSPVLVGVDGSRVGECAVAAAFEEASVRRVPLVAVHVWTDVAIEPWFPVDDREWEEIDETERAVLAERLAGWQEKYPDVEVRRVVERDRPVRYLIEHAENAQLIVVGSRGRGGMTGMLLGSTSRALLYMAPCPVLIARSPRA
ncbi:Nucleotide-binding universal stress protein, UspA family [Saccharopolyspora kobensis]|uniref:Nucleotide-binding universal stress protein, UspA family n=1 Tax=Saccharopolyspora kobensis TaxID=146035 RepID=A0A1H5V5J7_9PSEU|nr:universal stress protein [Saccharopolyspora kobensis]SEF82466.1 Nucleotide-binding universal stress protein, UspA family [Saccharopolyspora kobensis]SFC65125.1 Nucleotide-binding universal stress protein, UspA family [Saccharopolyspora kobensis]